MRILIVNSFYFPNVIGGTENSLKILSEKLVDNGHEVIVYTVDSDICSNKYDEINGVIIYRCNVKIFRKKFLSNDITYKILQQYNPFIKNDIKSIIEIFKPEIAHTNNLYGISMYIWKCLKENNIPIIHTLRDYWLLKHEKIKKYLLPIDQYNRKKYMNLVDVVTAPSEFILSAFLKKQCFSNAFSKVVSNCINFDDDYFAKIISFKKNRETIPVKFLYVGTLEKYKGVDKLLHAFSSMINSRIELVICGRGRLDNMVKRFTAMDKRILYMGQLKEAELEIVYLDCDVLIVPSVWDEPFGRVIIEANLHGVPVIASNVGGIPEILQKMQSGILIDPLQQNQLKKAIEKMCDRKLIRKFLSAIEANMEFYSSEHQLEEFLKLYRQVMKSIGGV